MSTRNYSPIAITEQFLFEKIGTTKFKVWQYIVLLTLLFIIPIFLPASAYQNQYSYLIFITFIVITWMSSRLVGRQLSKQSSIDSVLIYRFFAAVSWIIPTIAGVVYFLYYGVSADSTSMLINAWLLGFMAIVSTAHVIGIVIHIKKMNATIKNVKKEDLFQ